MWRNLNEEKTEKTKEKRGGGKKIITNINIKKNTKKKEKKKEIRKSEKKEKNPWWNIIKEK
jgi:hypothetical protein